MKCRLAINKPHPEYGDRSTNVFVGGLELNPTGIVFDEILDPNRSSDFMMKLVFLSSNRQQKHELAITDMIRGEFEFEIPDDTYENFMRNWRAINGIKGK